MTINPTQRTRFPRGRRTGPAVLIAAVILLSAAAIGYVCVLKGLQRNISGIDLGAVSRRLSGTAWDAPAVLVTGIVAAAVGVLILAVAILPAARPLVELDTPDDHTAAALSVRSLRRTVASAALRIDGISLARARIGRRRVHLDLHTRLRHTDGLLRSAQDAAGGRLRALTLARPRKVAAHLTRKDS